MKLHHALGLCCVSVSGFAHAGEVLIGTITSTGTAVANQAVYADAGPVAATAVPFSIPRDAKLSVQCDAAAYLFLSNGSQLVAATSTNSIKVPADALFLTSSPPGGTGETVMYLSMISVSGTANCRVFTRRGNEG